MNKKIKLVSIVCLAGIWAGISVILLLLITIFPVVSLDQRSWFTYLIFPSLTALWIPWIRESNFSTFFDILTIDQLGVLVFIYGFFVNIIIIYMLSFLWKILKITISKLKRF